MKTALTWTIAAALMVGAWLVSLAVPNEVAWRDGYAVTGALGEEISDRNMSVTVHSVSIVSIVTEGSDSRARSDDAQWVVIKLSAQALTDETEASLTHATLTVNGDEYRPSDRLRNGMERSTLSIAAPAEGFLVFEIPEPYAGATAELRLGARWDVDNADTYLSFTVDLAEAQRVAMMAIEPKSVGY